MANNGRLTAWGLLLAGAAALAAGAISASPADAQQRDTSAAARAAQPRDSALRPAPDQARGVDAEIRAALFELANDRALPALSRLQWLRSSPTALSGVGSGGAYRSREDLLFLLSQAYYRLGATAAFEGVVKELGGAATGQGRYAGVLQPQLMVETYRRGDYARASSMASAASAAGDGGLASMVVGLSQYAQGNYAAARTAFGAASQAGGAYAPYAQYMDAMAMAAPDTTQRAAAAGILRTLAQGNQGEFADQVNVAAAQLAYQAGQFDQAAQLAGNVQAASGLGASATLVRAWALYRANQLEPAAAAFRDFAQRFAQLPQRDEARLMAGQVMLQAGRTDDAGRYFQAVADSLKGEASAMQPRTAAGGMTDAARALVASRSASLLFVRDPAAGRTLGLPDAAGSGLGLLARAVTDQPPQAAAAEVARPEVISLADIDARFGGQQGGSGVALAADFPRRLLFVPEGQGTNRAGYLQRASELREADVGVAVANYRLQEQLAALRARIALLEQLKRVAAEFGTGLGAISRQVTLARDSAQRLSTTLEARRGQIRAMLSLEVDHMRAYADSNAAEMAAMRQQMGAAFTPLQDSVLRIEATTSQRYRQMADLIAGSLDRAVANHPVFRLQDSIRAHFETTTRVLSEMEGLLQQTTALLDQELARLRAAEPENIRAARAAVTAAEARRGAAEGQVVAVVDAELRARANLMLGILRHDTEAAEFGSASAAFFKAVDAGRAAGAGTSGSGAGNPSDGRDAQGVPPQTTGKGSTPR